MDAGQVRVAPADPVASHCPRSDGWTPRSGTQRTAVSGKSLLLRPASSSSPCLSLTLRCANTVKIWGSRVAWKRHRDKSGRRHVLVSNETICGVQKNHLSVTVRLSKGCRSLCLSPLEPPTPDGHQLPHLEAPMVQDIVPSWVSDGAGGVSQWLHKEGHEFALLLFSQAPTVSP